MSQKTVTLVPNKLDLRHRTFALSPTEWSRAVQLVSDEAFRPNTHAGIDRNTTRLFASDLEKSSIVDADRPALAGLCGFLRGAGAAGCLLEHRFQGANAR